MYIFSFTADNLKAIIFLSDSEPYSAPAMFLIENRVKHTIRPWYTSIFKWLPS